MILCETARDGRTDAEHLAIFASQLAALGLPARIDVGAVPERAGLHLQFDLAPLLADGGLAAGDTLALLAADQLGDRTLLRLRRLAGEAAGVRVCAFGSFAATQTALGVRARLAYVLGREPELFDLGPEAGRPAPAFGVPPEAPTIRPEVPRLLLVGPDLRDPAQVAALGALAPRRGLRLAVLTDSRTKHDWIAAHGHGVPVFAYGEALPRTLAGRTDLAVCFGRVEGSFRLQSLVANLLLAGVPVLDGTAGHLNAAENDALCRRRRGSSGSTAFSTRRSCRISGRSARTSRRAAPPPRPGRSGCSPSSAAARAHRAGSGPGRRRGASSSCRRTASASAMRDARPSSPARWRRTGRGRSSPPSRAARRS